MTTPYSKVRESTKISAAAFLLNFTFSTRSFNMEIFKELKKEPSVQPRTAESKVSRALLCRLFGSCLSTPESELGLLSPEPNDDSLSEQDINHNSNEVSARVNENEVKSKLEDARLGKNPAGSDKRGRTTDTARSVSNPLKKYAPVSVPGWEVNVIYKPKTAKGPAGPSGNRNLNSRVTYHTSVNNVPPRIVAQTYDSHDVNSEVKDTTTDSVKLLSNTTDHKDCSRDIVTDKAEKSILWKPLLALQRLMRRIRGVGEDKGNRK